MSRLNAIKVFRDLLSFLTIIPLAKTEDFVSASARNMFLFPLVGGLIGLFAAGYLWASGFILSYLLWLVSYAVQLPAGFLLQAVPAAMTLAFLLVLTGFQHFDGLVDLGNAVGLRRVEERREIAHRWVVTYKGALLAIFVEFAAFVGLFFLNGFVALRALVVAEVAAKLAMVTIVWRGKPAHAGLGARFLGQAKRRLNAVAYMLGLVAGFALLGLAGLLVIGVAFLFGLFMESVGKRVFGGVSGDMIGATNEGARALALVLSAVLAALAAFLLWGALWL
ncbi:MAG: adenosylcobinamide-GDP ribazoletransferase [Candidatus Bathyarchaeia archaeon]